MIHTREKAKELGQFFTPIPIADFMAKLVGVPDCPSPPGLLRILDPGSGKGCLGFALARRLIGYGHSVEIVFVEQDPKVLKILEDEVRKFRDEHGLRVQVSVLKSSFLSKESRELGLFDFAILNPPYFKINKSDIEASNATSRLFRGSPNVYASFMGLSLSHLKTGGQMVSITPRSFANGAYFKGFRQYVLSEGRLEKCFVLESRKEAFGSQKVLQENVITLIRRGGLVNEVIMSSIEMESLEEGANCLKIPSKVACPGPDETIRMPLTQNDLRTLDKVEAWTETLSSLDLRVSTGPVVEHRSEGLIVAAGHNASIPLIRMHNVKCGLVTWSGKHRKDARFLVRPGKSQRLLIQNEQGILILKRFTSKEERRRIVVGSLDEALGKEGPWLAIENHLNYIAGNRLSDAKFSIGLTVLLNSTLMDNYFRIISGNTQVNATDLRNTPFPSCEIIQELGNASRLSSDFTAENCSALVNAILG